MQRAAILQTVAIATVCALFVAKVPSLMEPGAPAFSWLGALAGASIAVIAGLMGSFFSSVNPRYEPSASILELRLLRGAVVALAASATGFTAFLYTPFPWLKAITGVSVVTGAACVFVALIVKWAPGRRT